MPWGVRVFSEGAFYLRTPLPRAAGRSAGRGVCTCVVTVVLAIRPLRLKFSTVWVYFITLLPR